MTPYTRHNRSRFAGTSSVRRPNLALSRGGVVQPEMLAILLRLVDLEDLRQHADSRLVLSVARSLVPVRQTKQ
jgi:hypothetical protein